MIVGELREKLENYDSESEVFIVDGWNEARGIRNVGLDPYFENETENKKFPLCIHFY